MALSQTTLSTAALATDITLALTSSTGFLVGQPVRIDNEYMFCVAVPSTTSITVRSRGAEGTQAVAHGVLANVITGVTATDFPAIPAAMGSLGFAILDDIVTIGANTASIACPARNTTFLLAKATALGTTVLAAPSTAQNGVKLTFTSQTAAAHVITATTLIENGLTGSPFTTCTFPAFIGSSMVLEAQNGVYQVLALGSGPVVFT